MAGTNVSDNHQPILAAKSTITGQFEYLTSTSGILNVSGSGGGGGGAVTIADGADVTQGAIADAAITAGSAGTISGKLRQISSDISSIKSGIPVTANAGTNLNTSALALETGGNLAVIAGAISSSVVQSNIKQVNGSTVAVAQLAGSQAVGGGVATATALTAGTFPLLIAGSDYGGTPKIQNILVTSSGYQAFNYAQGSAVSGADALGNNINTPYDSAGNGLTFQTRSWSYNGSTWDRFRGNNSGVVVAAGATSTQTNVTLTTYNAKKLTIVVNISAVSGGTVTVAINGTTSSSYTYPLLTSTALGTVAVTPLRIFPGASPSANAVANDAVPRNILITATVSGTITFGIDYVLAV